MAHPRYTIHRPFTRGSFPSTVSPVGKRFRRTWTTHQVTFCFTTGCHHETSVGSYWRVQAQYRNAQKTNYMYISAYFKSLWLCLEADVLRYHPSHRRKLYVPTLRISSFSSAIRPSSPEDGRLGHCAGWGKTNLGAWPKYKANNNGRKRAGCLYVIFFFP